MIKNRLIYIEDDLILGAVITQALAKNGFEVDFRTTLNELPETLFSTLPDLLILEIEVNSQNSLDILPAIRTQHPHLPIIIASSHTDGNAIIRSYKAGASHYIKKPYDIMELLFHIQKILQQPAKPTASVWTIGNYRVNTEKHLLIYPNKKIQSLCPKEFLVLQRLFFNKGQVVTRKLLLEEIWENDSSDESLNNIIAHLRKYFRQDERIRIKTYPCIGYLLDFY